MAPAEMERDDSKPAKTRKPRVYERPRGGPARQVADLVPQIGRAAFRRFGFVQSSVVTRWPEIVGPHHAKVCLPEIGDPELRTVLESLARSIGGQEDEQG